jgi:hypothetical protein
MMTIVERFNPGFQWAEAPHKGGDLEVELVGQELHVSGLFPRHTDKLRRSDLIWQYERAPKDVPVGNKRTGRRSPNIAFANADTDEKLIAFTQRFGPVVATSVTLRSDNPDSSIDSAPPIRILATQDWKELRSEHLIYRSALALVMHLAQRKSDYGLVQPFISTIADGIRDWPRQWKREKSQRRREPMWKLSEEAIERIEQLSCGRPDALLTPDLDSRIVICELLNSFRSIIYPNPVEMHGDIRYGIRPLLYSVLRRQMLFPRDFANCANTRCRNFFDIERAGQKFCSPECSQQERQRKYWREKGKKLRQNRPRQRREAK